MGIEFENKKQIENVIRTYIHRIEKALIFQLEYLVAELENHAKLSGAYQDQTSNLRGSIGGVVLKDGKPISYSGFDAGGDEGQQTGKEYAQQLAKDFTNGYVILIVAGMEYATYVEDIHDLNVLRESELKMQREIPKVLERMKLKLVA